MNQRTIFLSIGGLFLAVMLTFPIGAGAAAPADPAASPSGEATKEGSRDERQKIRVEIFLSPERKGEVDAVKKAFEALSITNVHPQVFRKGNPPRNIGFGREIPAEVAREAIRLAAAYNGGILFFLPEKRLAPHYVGIGVSIFDEAFQIPVGADDLKRLSDPALTTPQFHDLYRELTDRPPRINR